MGTSDKQDGGFYNQELIKVSISEVMHSVSNIYIYIYIYTHTHTHITK
jgi:hypothetical protein